MRIFCSLCISLLLHVLVIGEFLDMANASRPLHGATPESFRQINATLSPVLTSQTTHAETGIKQTELHDPILSPPRKSKSQPAPPKYYPPFLDVYHLRQELTRQPQLIANVDLSPLISLASGSSTAVIVELYINEQGNIDKIDTTANDLPAEALDKLSELLMQLRFSSGEIDGDAVKTRMKIEVMFLPGKQETR